LQALLITAYVEVLDEIWSQDASGQEVRVKGVFDLGAAAEYTIIEKLNLFIRTENLLGRHNERWLGYPSFGFNIYGGVRFRF
jgi:outer membrane cobalamin receptor